jgi:hypothetical protein
MLGMSPVLFVGIVGTPGVARVAPLRHAAMSGAVARKPSTVRRPIIGTE